MPRQSELFHGASAKKATAAHAPLAERMRPRTIDEFVGQEHLLGRGHVLRDMIESGRVESLILWGPPGSGKTTLAHLLAAASGAPAVSRSEEHTSELQSRRDLVCRLLLEKKKLK